MRIQLNATKDSHLQLLSMRHSENRFVGQRVGGIEAKELTRDESGCVLESESKEIMAL